MSAPFVKPGSETDETSWADLPTREDVVLRDHEIDRYQQETRRQKALAGKNEFRAAVSFLIGMYIFLIVVFMVVANPYIAIYLEISFPEIYGPNYSAKNVLESESLIYFVILPFVVSFIFAILASTQSGVRGKFLPRPLRWLQLLFGGGTS